MIAATITLSGLTTAVLIAAPTAAILLLIGAAADACRPRPPVPTKERNHVEEDPGTH